MNLDFHKIHSDWASIFEAFFDSQQGRQLQSYLQKREENGAVIFPPTPFLAFESLSLKEIKVVILGQDPYHEPGQAQGLAFHVPCGIKIPPSLKNIHKELHRSLGIPMPEHGELFGWLNQGVLLLNTVLTVEQGKANSHAKKGWEILTDQIIQTLGQSEQPKVFLLWGRNAQSKLPLIDPSIHLVLQANHPSPLSALRPPIPFIGCNHFALTNQWLQQKGITPIYWENFY